MAGREEAVKDRPVVVVLATMVRDDMTDVIVAPITTQPPRSNDGSIEMPLSVKRHLGLDDQRCWIITSELNRFIWPGPDIRTVNNRDARSPYYGKMPGKLFEAIQVSMRESVSKGRLKISKRTA